MRVGYVASPPVGHAAEAGAQALTPAVQAHRLDDRLRAAAFAYLDRLRACDGDRISYRDLEAFEFEGRSARA